jgi:hypothetical protein
MAGQTLKDRFKTTQRWLGCSMGCRYTHRPLSILVMCTQNLQTINTKLDGRIPRSIKNMQP